MTRFNALGKVSENNVLRWTDSARECYKNGLRCQFCTIPEDLKKQCRMKPCVIELVKRFGAPTWI